MTYRFTLITAATAAAFAAASRRAMASRRALLAIAAHMSPGFATARDSPLSHFHRMA